ncbi:ethanolamine-phosphate cytidylyltransferase-like isoform X1 [Rhynchophorus ferrugineus]|uniref:ethanolamine-phosphate cytidylyltransferase-like isoform X1 n=1 Tax=Rhynchophorus ferrugineus TaxID=354439 RepID=UPI003FCDDF5A
MAKENIGDIRHFTDGCFDLTHFGHTNFFRQAKGLGGRLIVGLHSDEEIEIHKKRKPIYTMEERAKMVRAIKWVDEVVEGVPYVTTVKVLEKYNCNFCIHADDITVTADGRDTYQEVKDANRFKTVPRTPGVSTTKLRRKIREVSGNHKQDNTETPLTDSHEFITDVLTLKQFLEGIIPAENKDKIIYVDGSFDLFHGGHVDFLEKALQQGTYLIVGLHSDEEVRRRKGPQYPLINLLQRAMNVLSYRYVSNVILDAPYQITEQLMEEYKIDLVIHGQAPILENEEEMDRYKVPIAQNKFRIIDSGNDMTTEDLINRIANTP